MEPDILIDPKARFPGMEDFFPVSHNKREFEKGNLIGGYELEVILKG